MPSEEVVVRLLPPSPKTAESTAQVCPFRTLLHSPDFSSQSLAVVSLEAVTRYLQSGEKHTEYKASVCPVSVHQHLPSSVLQTLAVQSSEAVAMLRRSGEKVAAFTNLWCPSKVSSHWPVAALKILAVLSRDVVTMAGHGATVRLSPSATAQSSNLAEALSRVPSRRKSCGNTGSAASIAAAWLTSRTCVPRLKLSSDIRWPVMERYKYNVTRSSSCTFRTNRSILRKR
mmetsp:Transcript_24898/g.52787  ORF Transcript_24898/g.52787 Transcript_24898/m.52787 type:complete len:229 (-) Transcript_24898:500-1186(-)